MQLLHLHTVGTHDHDYKKGKEIFINKDKYNNRLYDRVMGMNPSVDTKNYRRIIEIINKEYKEAGYLPLKDKLDAYILFDFMRTHRVLPGELERIHKDISDILLGMIYFKRELALEEFRKENCPDKPSRFHSLFACTEDELEYWTYQITDGTVEVFLIDAMDEVFKTNEQLLPDENLSYIMAYNQARKYFNPKNKDLNNAANEYLVQGKVRILEKLGEYKRNK